MRGVDAPPPGCREGQRDQRENGRQQTHPEQVALVQEDGTDQRRDSAGKQAPPAGGQSAARRLGGPIRHGRPGAP